MASWTFARNSEGAEEHGFHNPGVETFKGILERYLAREALQNSLDARLDLSKPVKVKFTLATLKADDVPDMQSLAKSLRRCAEYWKKDKRASSFFERAYELARADELICLQIGDSNTTGVSGQDTDQDQGWYTLVRSSGASIKGPGEGGSFGLGKHAPFAASFLRTVLYSTLTQNKQAAFQGVARLATHLGDRGRPQQPTGFLGGENGCSIRNKTKIPKAFRRQEPGTDIFVLAYASRNDWQDHITYEVLESFWPAIHRNDLSVEIGTTAISKRTLPGLLEKYAGDHKDFEAHRYFRAYTECQEMFSDLPILGKVSVRLLTGDAGYPNHVAMIRKTGMVIYHRRSRSSVPFCGVFECRNDTGNQKLRDMEPPRHDDWDANLPEQGDNIAAKKELDDYIIQCVKSLAQVGSEEAIVIPDLSQYLPDDDNTPEDGFDGPTNEEAGKHESFDRTSKKQSIAGRRLGQKPATQPGGKSTGADDDAGGGGDGDGDTGGPPNEGDGGDRGSQGGGGDAGQAGGSGGRTPVIIKARAFLRDAKTGAYSITVHPPQPLPLGEVCLSVSAVGDDTIPVPLRIKSALLDGGRELKVPRLGSIGPVKFPRSGPLRVQATLDQPRRLALDISAYEVAADETE